MFLAYYDESGDDGHPKTSSPFFVLSVVYQHHLVWKENYERVKEFKRQIAKDFPFPEELHTREFLLNKNPYFGWAIEDADRLDVIDLYCQLSAQLNLKIINVVIVKPRIPEGAEFNVLDTALTYSIQRIENDLNPEPKPFHGNYGLGPSRQDAQDDPPRSKNQFHPIQVWLGTTPARNQKTDRRPAAERFERILLHSAGRYGCVHCLAIRCDAPWGWPVSVAHAFSRRLPEDPRLDGNACAGSKLESGG